MRKRIADEKGNVRAVYRANGVEKRQRERGERERIEDKATE